MARKNIFRRRFDGRNTEDTAAISNIEYNPESGSQKNIEVGPALKYEKDLATATHIRLGEQLFIFKSTAGVGYVTLGDTNTITVGTAPAADTFPVFGQQYTRISGADYKYIIGTADIHLYVLRDDGLLRINPTP